MRANYYARFNQNKEKQLLKEHLLSVGELCRQQGKKVGLENTAFIVGVLHDLGKYSEDFQIKLERAMNDLPTANVNHSNAGAELLFSYHPLLENAERMGIEIMANAILTHHSTPIDFFDIDSNSPFMRRINLKCLTNDIVNIFFTEVIPKDLFERTLKLALAEIKTALIKHYHYTKNMMPKISDGLEKGASYLVNYIYSVLIDSDRTNSYQFEVGNKTKTFKSNLSTLKNFSSNLEKTYTEIESNSEKTTINQLRSKMANQCLDNVKLPKGVYKLSTPVGGGKTLSSMRFAINHAIQNNQDRVFYFLPYTVIIEQNSKTLKEILGNSRDIFEHHSNVEYEGGKRNEFGVHNKENWDTTLVISTFYQFLSAFFEDSSKSLRKFSKLANSVIIIDEIQSLPIHTIQLLNTAIDFLVSNLGCTVLICTATQPNYSPLPKEIHNIKQDLISISKEDLNSFKRTNFVDDFSECKIPLEAEDVSEYVYEKYLNEGQVLCILNTKKMVKQVYKQLVDFHLEDVTLIHLSTAMCVEHRTEKINKMKEILNTGGKVICITTPLIEAGVDISFKSVIRSLSGLDNIVQASGRANRNGEYSSANVYLIDVNENLRVLPSMNLGKKTFKLYVKYLKSKYAKDYMHYLDTPENIDWYSRKYYFTVKDLTDNVVEKTTDNLVHYISRRNVIRNSTTNNLTCTSGLRTLQSSFKVFNSETTSVIVDYSDSRKIIERFVNGEIDSMTFLNDIQKYSVNLFANDVGKFKASKSLKEFVFETPFKENSILILDNNYDSDLGVISEQ